MDSRWKKNAGAYQVVAAVGPPDKFTPLINASPAIHQAR